jgi:hypothetical protein
LKQLEFSERKSQEKEDIEKFKCAFSSVHPTSEASKKWEAKKRWKKSIVVSKLARKGSFKTLSGSSDKKGVPNDVDRQKNEMALRITRTVRLAADLKTGRANKITTMADAVIRTRRASLFDAVRPRPRRRPSAMNKNLKLCRDSVDEGDML